MSSTNLSEEEAQLLAKYTPRGLLQLLRAGSIHGSGLFFAVEFAGQIDEPDTIEVLLPYLTHPLGVVREGTVYGLGRHANDPRVRTALERVAHNDASEAVRSAAADALA